MAAYRLYTVVPFLVKFIEQLTNIYVSGGARSTRRGGREGWLGRTPVRSLQAWGQWSAYVAASEQQATHACGRTRVSAHACAPHAPAHACPPAPLSPAPAQKQTQHLKNFCLRHVLQVRYNRKRLKGGGGREDALYALASLYNVLMSVCKAGGARGRGGAGG